jgi:kynurenine formamidase
MMRYSRTCSGAVFIALLLLPASGEAQTRQSGPWWPNPEWGADDQAGASNRITPEKVMEALSLATTGKTYDLGQVYEAGMPLYGERSYTMVLPANGPMSFGDNRLVGNEEFLSTQIGQVGTQFDGLGHVGQQVEMEDGRVEFVFYNGFTSEEMNAPGGLQKLGIEHIRPIITRGLLIDIAGYKGVPKLPNSYEVTVDDVLGALEKQGIPEASIEPGDALLFRYGWSSLWDQAELYNTNPPGIGLDVARWVAGRNVTMVGSDSWTGEVVPNPDPGLLFPVHQELMMKNGIFNLENMQFDELVADGVNEFLFIVTTIPFKGATGSPARPIAIR